MGLYGSTRQSKRQNHQNGLDWSNGRFLSIIMANTGPFSPICALLEPSCHQLSEFGLIIVKTRIFKIVHFPYASRPSAEVHNHTKKGAQVHKVSSEPTPIKISGKRTSEA